jgi:lipopolysaccharide/colanic/teichoic acid biosynthesis glycosyltransferase
MNIVRERTAVAARPRGVGRLRSQLALGLLLAVVIPALVPAVLFGAPVLLTNPSVIGTAIALMAGVMLYRRLTTFPGVRNIEYVLPAFSIAYGAVILALFFARIDYSRLQYGASFMVATLLFLAIATQLSKIHGRAFFVVPFGHVDSLLQIRDVAWIPLTEPVLPPLLISGVVADLRSDFSDDWERLIADASLSGAPVYHVKQLSESLTGRVDIEHISENNLGSLIPNLGYFKLKFLLDLFVAMALLPILLPLFAAIAIAIRLDSPGPIFFRQMRLGYRGVPFRVFKFRTMQDRRHANLGPDHRRQAAMTEHGDERITQVGRFLRRSRLDELPQVFNILRGEMSWIGPRPEAQELADWYEAELPFYRYRHIVRPGITGWAQVSQGHVAQLSEVHEKLQYDFYYIKYFSGWLDSLIVMKTVQTVLTGFGSK